LYTRGIAPLGAAEQSHYLPKATTKWTNGFAPLLEKQQLTLMLQTALGGFGLLDAANLYSLYLPPGRRQRTDVFLLEM
jgi:hypothetical protein